MKQQLFCIHQHTFENRTKMSTTYLGIPDLYRLAPLCVFGPFSGQVCNIRTCHIRTYYVCTNKSARPPLDTFKLCCQPPQHAPSSSPSQKSTRKPLRPVLCLPPSAPMPAPRIEPHKYAVPSTRHAPAPARRRAGGRQARGGAAAATHPRLPLTGPQRCQKSRWL